MADVNGPDPQSSAALTDLDVIRSWADRHGAVPVRSETTAGPPVGFAFADDPDERISWNRFGTSFEQSGLALLVDGTDFAFVGRSRVAGRHEEDGEPTAAGRDGRGSVERSARDGK
jgi:hypothetical protein